MAKIKPITFDPKGSFIPENGITAAQVEGLADRVGACDRTVLRYLFQGARNILLRIAPIGRQFVALSTSVKHSGAGE